MRRVLVCGGRMFTQRQLLRDVLDPLLPLFGTLIHGNQRGADKLAAEWARYRGLDVLAFDADWERFGKGAGPIRNQRMLDEGKPDIVVAFPGGNGTLDMVTRARRAGVPVLRVQE